MCPKKQANPEVVLKEIDQYYYQVQGKLAITNRSRCYFFVWCKHWNLCQIIEKDDSFWESNVTKLSRY